MSNKLIYFILALTFFAFGIRLFRFTEPNRYYFDEVYHAVTAKAYADNDKRAYDPFSQSPKPGTAYDWLHPPLAKLIQAGSIKIFGDKPFGWRLPSIIFGTAIIPAAFILGFLLFGPTVAVITSLVLTFENLNLVMSRVTMNDVFVTFFIIVAFIWAYLYTKNGRLRDLVLTSIFLGLAIASKWTGIYALAVTGAFIFFENYREDKIDWRLIILFIIPPILYLASYLQFFLLGYGVKDLVNLHKQIWWYQNRHDLKHSYGTTAVMCAPEGLDADTTWCPWVLDVRGVYFSYEQYGQNAGYIYALGNPIIFWAGIIAVSYVFGKYLEEKSKEQLLILLGYFIFWVPWIFSPRILFLYHYLPSLPFLAISLGLSVSEIYRSRYKILAIGIILLFAIAFFYLYPISTGWPIKPSDIDKFMLLKTWR